MFRLENIASMFTMNHQSDQLSSEHDTQNTQDTLDEEGFVVEACSESTFDLHINTSLSITPKEVCKTSWSWGSAYAKKSNLPDLWKSWSLQALSYAIENGQSNKIQELIKRLI